MTRITSLIISISLILISLGVITGCDSSEGRFRYEGPFYSLEMSDSWHMHDFGGDNLKIHGYYRCVTFSKRPIQLRELSEINQLEYAITCASIFDSTLTQGDFETIEIPSQIAGITIVEKKQIEIDGVPARWLECETTFEGEQNASVLLDVPLNNGYIQIDFFGPKGDESLQTEARRIVRSLTISNPDYFIENTQKETWRRE